MPDDLPSDIATLAEPLAVALHAVNRGALGSDDVPIVIGCGPIGLAVIAVLKMRGVGPDHRRGLLADATGDGREARRRHRGRPARDIAVRLLAGRSPPRPILRTWARQTLMFPGFAFRPSVVFECVGVPGVIQQILAGAAPCSKVVVAGLCMEQDTFEPTFAVLKEVDVVFSHVLHARGVRPGPGAPGRGELQVAPLITSHVALAEVPEAFARLADPERDAKIIVVP